jgi:DNA primase
MTSRGVFEDFAKRHLDVANVSGEEAMVRCVVHDDSKASMQFNLRTGLWVCFACHEGGSIKKLCRELGISVYAEPEPDIDDIRRKLRELEHPTKQRLQVQDESLLKRYSLPTRYWTGRGFDQKTIKAFDLGIDMMSNAATIPLRNEHGQLLGVIKRYLDEDVELRYRYPKGFKRSMNLFGSWLVEEADTDMVVLVEGSVDAMKVWQAGFPALAIYGSSLSPTQARLLRRLGVGQVVTFFDNDKAGREASAWCLGQKTKRRKAKNGRRYTVQEYDPRVDLRRWFLVSQAGYKAGWKSDPGALSAKQIRKAVTQAPLLNLG